MNHQHRRTLPPRWRPYRGSHRPAPFGYTVASWSIIAAIVAWNAAPEVTAAWRNSSLSAAERTSIEQSAYYRRCAEAWAAGVAPISRGSPGYREGLDGDGDGEACEPYR